MGIKFSLFRKSVHEQLLEQGFDENFHGTLEDVFRCMLSLSYRPMEFYVIPHVYAERRRELPSHYLSYLEEVAQNILPRFHKGEMLEKRRKELRENPSEHVFALYTKEI